MKKKSHAWCWFVVIGAMLFLAALLLVLYNLREDRMSGENADRVLAELKQQIEANYVEPEPTGFYIPTEADLFHEYDEEETAPPPPEEPVVELEGHQYLGFLTIPSQNIELPVLSSWSYPNLRIAPCRYKGTVADGDLIIAAHNYSTHFGGISQLHSDDLLLFTDANGIMHAYRVRQKEQINGKDIDAMLYGAEEEWDLTLFTCTLSGSARVTVRTALIEE